MKDKGARKSDPISLVERFGHNVLIIRDETIKTKQTWCFLQRWNGGVHPTTEGDPETKTYAICPRVDIDDQLRIDDSTPQGTLWVFMMGEEESGYFPVSVVTIDLEQG